MRPVFKLLLLLFFTFTIFSASAQNNQILNELNKGKTSRTKSYNSSSYNSSSSYSSGSDVQAIFILFDLFRFMGVGLARLQSEALKQRPNYREITSLEASLNAGYYSKYNGVVFAPHFRANWGIFSTDFRYQRIEDQSNVLETYDWQVLKLNVPIKHFKASVGMGFTEIPQVNSTFFEYSIGGQLRFHKERMLAEIMYRKASEFREDLKMSIDYEVKNYPISKNARIHFSPMIGFNYQNYFDVFSQYYIVGGLNIRLY